MSSLARSSVLIWPLMLFALAVPRPASTQGFPPARPALGVTLRASLVQSAADPSLADWQREFMRTLAGDRSRRDASLETDGSWAELTIGRRTEHSAIYDPVRKRMVVFGGAENSVVWVLSLDGMPAWSTLTPTGMAPPARANHGAVYDPLRDRMVIFGGVQLNPPGSYAALNDVWALSLADPPAWTELVPGGTLPAPRGEHSVIYDPVRDRMVVFGGQAQGGSYGDAWVLSLGGAPAWAQLAPSGTPPGTRFGHSAIYDPVRDRMIVCGGYGASTGLADVWALSLAGPPVWTALLPSGAPAGPRSGQSAIYDPASDRMVIFGGQAEWYEPPLHDAWALSLSGTPAWSAIGSAGSPSGNRYGQSAVYDPMAHRMLVFGGCGDATVWSLSLLAGGAWAQLTAADPMPDGRTGHSAIYDPLRERMLVFGGYRDPSDGSTGYYDDVWALTLSGRPGWIRLTPSGASPPARNAHTAVYDAAGDRMLVFGGYSPNDLYGAPRNDVWALSLSGAPAWTELAPAGGPPSPRSGHSAIYDPVRNRMVVFGGVGGGNDFGDIWALSLSGPPSWTELTPGAGSPPGRAYHSAIYDPLRDRMVIFGGTAGGGSFNDVWSLTLSGAPAWTNLTPAVSPPGWGGHRAIYDARRDRMVVFGTISQYDFTGALELSLADPPTWTILAPTGEQPSPRSSHTAIYDPIGDRMVVYGGGSYLWDAWALRWSEPAVSVPAAAEFRAGLRPPAPSPSRGSVTLRYSIAQPGPVRLAVYSVGGRLVRTLVEGPRDAGDATVAWDGRDDSGVRVGAGVYLVRLSGAGLGATRKAVLVR